MNGAAWQLLGGLAAFVAIFALYDLHLYRRYGGPATASTGIRHASHAVTFLFGCFVGCLFGAGYVHFYLYMY